MGFEVVTSREIDARTGMDELEIGLTVLSYYYYAPALLFIRDITVECCFSLAAILAATPGLAAYGISGFYEAG